MSQPTYRRLPDGSVTVDAPGTCGKPFANVLRIVEDDNANPGIKITTSSGIVGSNLLRQVLADLESGDYLLKMTEGGPEPPRPSITVRWGSESTRKDNPDLEDGDKFEFDTEAEVNAFTEALAAADGWAEWEIIEPEDETTN